jgi:hypothetical protein
MLKAIITAALILTAPAAWANCRTHTVFTADGKVLVCQTCCYGDGSNCTTFCF